MNSTATDPSRAPAVPYSGTAQLPSGSVLEWQWTWPKSQPRSDTMVEARHGAFPLVMLHEGLGCITMWRQFPQAVADALGKPVLAYSRRGYGRSSAWPGPWSVDFMHLEAYQELPELLHCLGIERYGLVGHSDGASIALLHAARFPERVQALVALAPHLFVEPLCIEAIAATRQTYQHSGLAQGLARHHNQADPLFDAWSGIWLNPAFLTWNIEQQISTLVCPVLAIQGIQDQYGTLEQIDRLQAVFPAKQVHTLAIPSCRHSPHLDQPDVVLQKLVGWLDEHHF